MKGIHRSIGGHDYRAIGTIGRGGSSEVLEVIGDAGERRAMKVLRAALVAGEAASRLAREGRTLAALQHPNLVPVIDAGVTADGRPFLIMPRLVGDTLHDRIQRDGPMRADRACDLLAGVLDGLGAAHAAGVVHRDVKPANIFLVSDPDGGERAVLLDFGIAKVEGMPADPSTGAHVIGTPRYLAPEQVLGAAVDARTDVYAAGVVLFEAIAGRGPFDERGPIELMRAHLEDEPHRLGRFARVPADVDRAVARALAKPAELRWPTATAFAAALRRAARLSGARAS